MLNLCSDAVYQFYGSSNSPNPDMDKYRAEVANCVGAYTRDYISLPKLLWRLGTVEWGFIVIPPALLWIIIWGVGRKFGSRLEFADEYQATRWPSHDPRQYARAWGCSA